MLILANGAVSCNGKSSDKIPESIVTKKIPALTRMKGTHGFVAAPPAYKLLENLVRWQKDNETYLQVIESPTNFEEGRRKYSRGVIESGDAKLDNYQEGHVNSWSSRSYSAMTTIYLPVSLH